MTNRLSAEPSLYLRQHADNPVHWFAWGEEAFAEARARDCPVFVSVGYSACHWCHVMAHESFESPRTAALLNERFVSIKVDREERPDVDAALMSAVQAMTGHGGWPLTVFMTPDGRVFHGGTYYPPEPRGNMPAFAQVLLAVANAWAERRADVLAFSEALAGALARRDEVVGGSGSALAPLGRSADETRGFAGSAGVVLAGAAEAILKTEDRENGGFGWAPKFPQAPTLLFLLERAALLGDQDCLETATRALSAMATGGIHDQLAGGFHRYSVDERWVVPHFEKMLYDNAQLLSAYVMAFQLTGSERLRQVAHATAGYLLDDLRADGGAFCASTDADADGVEGSTFVWRPSDFDAVLGPVEAALAVAWYGVTDSGNFDGANVLTTRTTLAKASSAAGVGQDEARQTLAQVRPALLAARGRRVQPVRDEKVVAAWNGLAIHALARAAAALDWPAYGEAAAVAARFIRSEMGRSGGLARMWAGGSAYGHGFLEDYASMAGAAVTLWEWDFDPGWLSWACELTEALLDRFDTDAVGDGSGPLPRAGAEHGAIITPDREVIDSAEPSGNALAAAALLRLGAITANERWTRRAESILAGAGGAIGSVPTASGGLLSALALAEGGMATVSVIGERADPRTSELVDSLRHRALPRVVVGAASGVGQAPPAVLSGTTGPAGSAAATVCQAGACGPALSEPAAVFAALGVPLTVTAPLTLLEPDPCWPNPEWRH